MAQESLENEARTEGKWHVETTSVQARCSPSISCNDVGPAGVCFTAQRHAREQTGAPDTGLCVNNMEQLQDLHWRLECRKAVPIDLAYIPQMLLIVASAGRTCAMVGRCFGS